MQPRSFSSKFNTRQLIQLLPALVMILAWAALGLFGRSYFDSTGAVLGLLAVFWTGTSLWRVLGERYLFYEDYLMLVTGPNRQRMAYGAVVRVMVGDVTLPGSRMAKGALLLQPQGNGRSLLLYPRDMAGVLAILREKAPHAAFLTTQEELEAYRRG